MLALKISRPRHLAAAVIHSWEEFKRMAPDERQTTTMMTSLQYFLCIEPLCSNNGD
jgi:hypothetical protein